MTNEEILKDIGHPDLILSFPVFTAMTAAREEGRREGAAQIEALKERVRELEEGLEGLVDAIPAQDNDRDWWPDELVKSVAAARKLLNKHP